MTNTNTGPLVQQTAGSRIARSKVLSCTMDTGIRSVGVMVHSR